MSQTETVIVRILDKEYHIACPASESANLERAAIYLDTKMRDIRRTGKVVGAERIAVMAALNITYALHRKEQEQASSDESSEQVQQLVSRVQHSLDETK
ncbi:cell division protein ZapA [Denitrificimonas sp. JX-1]|uniref:Cell division protein ZapA n=1 Tax=Denitrificimonas halotolerans TaxID=3098930 RepID=A0ABU5GPB3_9GAMM|nr:cell division protein ZapA [Denitrificimonas sp. JX-1]MDY7218357.1 cell division protein ZapA [Denitrificimonas sp. JX-1]